MRRLGTKMKPRHAAGPLIRGQYTLLPAFFLAFLQLAGCAPLPAEEDPFYRKACTVDLESEGSPSFESLVSNVEDNSGCGEFITFAARSEPYTIRQRTIIDDPYNLDLEGDGFSLFIDTNQQSVIFDGTSLQPDSCVIELDISGIHIGPATIIYNKKVRPICDFGRDNDLSGVQMKEIQ